MQIVPDLYKYLSQTLEDIRQGETLDAMLGKMTRS